MIIPKNKNKLRKLFIELRYSKKANVFPCGSISYPNAKLLLEKLSNKVFEGNGEYPHPPKLEESKSLWLDTLPEEIRLDLNFTSDDIHDSLEDEEWDATYRAAYGTKVIEFQEDHN